MLISTRGRYALRVLLDLAEHDDGKYIPMKEIAERQDLSLKYIERIMPALTQNCFVEGVQGKGGGYRLVRHPKDYKIGDILRLMQGDLSPVSCLECDAKPCDRAGECLTLPMWIKFKNMIDEYFDGITLENLLAGDIQV